MTHDCVFQEEILVLKKLHDLADKKRQALFANDWEALRLVTQAEEAAAKNLAALEETRLRQAGPFAEDKRDEMRRLVQDLKVKNDFNQVVLNDALAYTRFFLNAVMGVATDSPMYGAKGNVQETSYKQLIDGRG